MNVIVIDTEAFYKLLDEQKRIIKEAFKELKLEAQTKPSDLVSWEDALKILPYRSKTKWQELRDQGLIDFVNIGKRKILYSKQSLLNYIQAKKK